MSGSEDLQQTHLPSLHYDECVLGTYDRAGLLDPLSSTFMKIPMKSAM